MSGPNARKPTSAARRVDDIKLGFPGGDDRQTFGLSFSVSMGQPLFPEFGNRLAADRG